MDIQKLMYNMVSQRCMSALLSREQARSSFHQSPATRPLLIINISRTRWGWIKRRIRTYVYTIVRKESEREREQEEEEEGVEVWGRWKARWESNRAILSRLEQDAGE